MRFTILLTSITLATAGFWYPVANRNHFCNEIEECQKKCENGTYHERWNKTLSTYELRCDGKHSDYRFVHAVCRQEMSGEGTHFVRNKKSCDLVGGLYCWPEMDRPGPLKWKWSTLHRCTMEEQYFPEFFEDCNKESWNMDAVILLKDVPWDCFPEYLN